MGDVSGLPKVRYCVGVTSCRSVIYGHGCGLYRFLAPKGDVIGSRLKQNTQSKSASAAGGRAGTRALRPKAIKRFQKRAIEDLIRKL